MKNVPASTPRILLVNLYWGGHHAQYIEQLLRYRPVGCRMLVAVTDHLLKESPLLRGIVHTGDESVEVIRIPADGLRSGGTAALIRNDLEHGRQVRDLVRAHRPDHCLMMYFDHMQLSLAFDLRFNFPLGISGIYFRPTFHYDVFSSGDRSFRARFGDFRKEALLRGALRNPHVRHVFSLDPFAAERINEWRTDVDAVPLPDGADILPADAASIQVRDDWGAEAGRHIALLFGVIDSRKGVTKVLSALAYLDRSAQTRLCLALVGPIAAEERDEIIGAVAQARETTSVQIVLDDRYIQREEIQNILCSADSVLLTYQHHVGSSNVLVRAAAAGKPVIGPDHGLVGAYIRRHRLGLAIDSTDPIEIAKALDGVVSDLGRVSFDAAEAELFASGHTAERFAKTVYDTIIG